MFTFWLVRQTAFCTLESQGTSSEESMNMGNGLIAGFTKRHGVKRLVYFERHDDMQAAIQREHNIKHWSRKWKVRLILASNADWNDLYDSIT